MVYCLYIGQKFKLLQFCLYSSSYLILYDIFAYFILIHFFFSRIVCKTNPEAVSSFEQALFPIFQEILQQDIPGKLF